MKQNQPLFISAIAATLLFTACHKNDPIKSATTTVITIDKTGGNAAFAPLRSTPQTFTVVAGAFASITGAQGTILRFYANSFKDKNGNIITSGTVNIQLTEMYKFGDMIANRTATVTDNGVLTSGGELNIVATMGGEEVFANKYGIAFSAPAATTKPMEVYYGNNNNPDSITTWKPAQGGVGTTAAGTILTDSIPARAVYLFDSCTNFHLVNCDHPYDGSSKNVTINVIYPDTTFTRYSTMFVSYSSLNVATYLRCLNFYTSSNLMTYGGFVPMGATSKISIIMPKTADSYYYYEQSGIIVDGMNIIAYPTLLTKNQLAAKLAAL